jgi:alkylhydroperoxidase family enzyme
MRRHACLAILAFASSAALAARGTPVQRAGGDLPNTRALATPRVAPVAAAQWTDAQRAVVAAHGDGGNADHQLATLLNHPEMAAALMPVIKYFSTESELAPRHRELLILRTAWLCRSEYIWASHAADARQPSFTNAELRRIAQGARAPGWDRFEATLVGAADELYRNSSLSGATWNALSARFNQHQMMDAVFTVPAFTMMAMIDNSLGVQLEPGRAARLPADIPYAVQVPAREPSLPAARIPPLDPPEWTPAIRAMLDPAGSGRSIIGVYRTFARHPKLYAPRQLLSEHIRLQNTLSARVRELLILRVGWLGQSEYEWQQHVRTGRAAGLDTVQIAIGPDGAGWNAVDHSLLAAADEIYRSDMVSDATWASLTPHFDTRQMIDVLTTAGGYRMVSTVLNALGVQLEAGGERFPAVPRP